jgi:chromosome segregation ATPase
LKTDLKRFDDKLAKDPAAENKQILDLRKVTIRKIVDCVGEISRVVLDRRELDNKIAIEQECHKVLYQGLDDAHDAVTEARKSLEQLKINKKAAERRRDEVKVKVEECRNELTELKETHCNGDDSSFREYFKKVMDATGDYKGLDAINYRISQLEVQLQQSVDNQALLIRYNKTKVERDLAKIDMDALKEAHEKMIDDIESRSKNWFEQVEGVQQKLNMQFGKYMDELGYEGAVELRKIGNVDKHEMQMRVNFNQGTLTDLSGQRHSGGERAVSTIMYLMALQEMTHTPFRAVDEINQGMDERNERLVFDRIVQTCCLPERPQYFLVSPKLLQGLRAMEHDDVTVLMVWNGPGVTYSWKFTEIVDSILSCKRGRQQDDASDQRGPARKR